MPLNRKIRYGMVGGGPDAFIGAVHRKAAALDGQIDLIAGAFSSSPEKSRQQGAEIFLDANRVYGSYKEMAEKESQLPEGERIDFVSIVTPNHVHFDVAKTFIEAGFHVVCDKPMTTTVADAETLCHLVKEHDVVFALTHNYTGYPMVKQARELVKAGKLGTLRKIVVEYPQGWLATFLENEGAKQAVWRTDPKQAGASSCIGDIGSHAENLAHYITGLEIEEICADMTTFVEGRLLEDDGNLLVHYEEGVRGVLYASQISVGEENNLRIRVYGTDASLEWNQENPNYLYVRFPDGPEQIYKRGNDYLSEVAQHNSRIPSGHPEAFLEAFANIYVNAARTIAAKIAGEAPAGFDTDFPTVQDGARGVHFINAAVELVHYEEGVRGVLYASQISVGEENNLRIRVYGTDASLEWQQENPNYLYVRFPDGPEQIYKRGNDYLSEVAQHNSRIPSGHPEAFLEAFANIYVNAARTIAAKIAGEAPAGFDTDFPTVQDGARGVHFINAAVDSGKQRAWIDASYTPPA